MKNYNNCEKNQKLTEYNTTANVHIFNIYFHIMIKMILEVYQPERFIPNIAGRKGLYNN